MTKARQCPGCKTYYYYLHSSCKCESIKKWKNVNKEKSKKKIKTRYFEQTNSVTDNDWFTYYPYDSRPEKRTWAWLELRWNQWFDWSKRHDTCRRGWRNFVYIYE